MGNASLISILRADANCEDVAHRSFRSGKCSATSATKIPQAEPDCGRQAFIATLSLGVSLLCLWGVSGVSLGVSLLCLWGVSGMSLGLPLVCLCGISVVSLGCLLGVSGVSLGCLWGCFCGVSVVSFSMLFHVFFVFVLSFACV